MANNDGNNMANVVQSLGLTDTISKRRPPIVTTTTIEIEEAKDFDESDEDNVFPDEGTGPQIEQEDLEDAFDFFLDKLDNLVKKSKNV